MKDVEFWWWTITDDWGRRRKSPCEATAESALQMWGETATRLEGTRTIRSIPATLEERIRATPKTPATDRTPLTPDSEFYGWIVELGRRNGKFMVQVDGGGFAVFALYDDIDLQQWDAMNGRLRQVGSELLHHKRLKRDFHAFGETGLVTKEDAWAALRQPRVPDL